MERKSLLRCLLAMALVLTRPGIASAAGSNWEFGRFAIGQSIQQPPSDIRKLDDCLRPDDPLTCDMLLSDGIWYLFEKRAVVRKRIEFPSPAIPSWIVATDSARTCKRRLQKTLGKPFRLWVDDYGVTFVETVDLIETPAGAYYNIIVTFDKNGRMQDLTQTPLPHEDV